MDAVFQEVTEAVNDTLQQYVDNRVQSGDDESEVMVQVGRALVMTGCVYLGNGLGIRDPEQGLQPGHDLLARFEAMQ